MSDAVPIPCTVKLYPPLLGSSLGMVIVAVLVPVLAGVNVTINVVVPNAASGSEAPGIWEVTLNIAESGPEVWTYGVPVKSNESPPLFSTVNVAAVPAAPTLTLP